MKFAKVLTAFAVTVAVSYAAPAHAHKLKAPSVPGNLAVPDGNHVFHIGHALGTQNYVCLPSGGGYAWTLFTPQATLSNDNGKQFATHFFSPNPDENGTVRPTWQDSRDTSRVWGQATATSTDANYVAPGAIAWVLLKKVGTEKGPNCGDDTLTKTTYIQRVNTSEGKAPADGCAAATDVGHSAWEPYSADYYFYAADKDDDD